MALWERVSLFGRVSKSWVSVLLTEMRKGGNEGMFGGCSHELSCDGNSRLRFWTKEPTLSRVLRTTRQVLLRNVLIGAVANALDVAQIVVVFRGLLLYLSDVTQLPWYGWMMASLLIVCNLCFVLVSNTFFEANSVLAIQVKSSLLAAVSHKLVHVNSADRNGSVSGLFGTDLPRVFQFFLYIPWLFLGPLSAAGVLVLVFLVLGWVAVPLLGLWCAVLLLQERIGAVLAGLYKKMEGARNQRLDAVQNGVARFQELKMCALEDVFLEIVDSFREIELAQLAKVNLLFAFVSCLALLNSQGSFVLTFGIFAGLGNGLDLTTLFVAIPLIGAALGFFQQFSNVVVMLGSVISSLDNVRRFLEGVEVLHLRNQPIPALTAQLVLTRATFRSSSGFVLANVSFSVEAGEFCFVFGHGKTTLLKGILGECDCVEGCVQVRGLVSYCSQDVWLYDTSVRSNILFGQPFDADAFAAAVQIAGLVEDLKSFAGGDRYEIAHGGANLSGGQRQRIALARALYSRRDIILLDDALSGVDVKVWAKIRLRLEKYVRGRCVVFASNNAHQAVRSDKVVHLKDGLVSVEPGEKRAPDRGDEISIKAALNESMTISVEDLFSKVKVEQLSSEDTVKFEVSQSTNELFFTRYLEYMGWRVCVFVVLFVLAYGIGVFLDFWVSFWSQGVLNFDVLIWTGAYVAIFGLGLVVFVTAALFFGYATSKVSERLPRKALQGIILSNLQFVSKFGVGAILNRFSNNVDGVDARIPSVLFLVTVLSIQVIAVFVVSGVVCPYSLFGVPLVGLSCVLLYLRFRHGNIMVQRYVSVVQSAVLERVLQLSSGSSILRVFGQESFFTQRVEAVIDAEATMLYIYWMLQRWFALRVQVICVAFVGISALLSVGLLRYPDTFAGLLLLYSFRLSQYLQILLRRGVDLEGALVSVGRLHDFVSAPSEGDKVFLLDKGAAPDIPENWPRRGRIEFVGVTMSYGRDFLPVLKNVSFVADAGFKVGIVGRTGSGKSSLILALFQLYDYDGQILIDGMDVARLHRWELRRRIAVIPQRDLILSCSVKRNMDPYNERCEADVRSLSSELGLSFVTSVLSGTDSCGGHSGEQHLVCVARGLLKQSKILVTDELTASLDKCSSERVQSAANKLSSTALIVAHRAENIAGSDRIMVLDGGRVAEFDTPSKLAAKEAGHFKSMLEMSDVEFDLLKSAELSKCEICIMPFSSIKKQTSCPVCKRIVCSFCFRRNMCSFCCKERVTENVSFLFDSLCSFDLDTSSLAERCTECSDPWTRECGICRQPFCDLCLVSFRNVANNWGSFRNQTCKSCWPTQRERILDFREDCAAEAFVECFQGDNIVLGQLLERCLGSCALCSAKGPIHKCEVCSSFVCGKKSCSGLIHVAAVSNRKLLSTCARCVLQVVPSVTYHGDAPAFLALSDEQTSLVNSKQCCSSCRATFSFFVQPFLCAKCHHFVCRTCCRGPAEGFLNVCDACSQKLTTPPALVSFLTCDQCKQQIIGTQGLWVNHKHFHSECYVVYRRRETADFHSKCHVCYNFVSPSDGVTLNGKIFHPECLPRYRHSRLEQKTAQKDSK